MSNNQSIDHDSVSGFSTAMESSITAFQKRMKRIAIIGVSVLILLLIAVFFLGRKSKSTTEVPFKEHDKLLVNEINELRKKEKQDSLDRISLYRQVDSLRYERQLYDKAFLRIDKRINTIQTGYEKISVRYADASTDSLNGLRSRFGK
jgi:uncharacterized protein YlxW (UPF0749 family)